MKIEIFGHVLELRKSSSFLTYEEFHVKDKILTGQQMNIVQFELVCENIDLE